MHEENCFITLTFAEEHLGNKRSLDKDDFQKFMKRLRKKFEFQKIRYFHCGEYGENFQRPHHHACLFGFDFPDKKLWSERNGVKIYSSELLTKIWGYGHTTVGDVTFESAAYVARYITKKITGKNAEKYYDGRKPEYTTMSLRPAIGQKWLDKYANDVFPRDFIVLRNVKMRPPKFYLEKFSLHHPKIALQIKNRRKSKNNEFDYDRTPDRQEVRETVKKAQTQQLRRDLECC